MLFQGRSITEIISGVPRQIREEVQNIPANTMLNASEEDVIRSVVSRLVIEAPKIDAAGIHVDPSEEEIDVSQDPMRHIWDRSQPFYIAGTKITFIIPFVGDGNLFKIQPEHFTWNSSGSRAYVSANEIHIPYSGTNIDAKSVRAQFDQEFAMFKTNIRNLEASIERLNTTIEQSTRTQVHERKVKLLADSSMVANLGFPIRRRSGAPTTYALPVQKRKPVIQLPTIKPGSFEPEPTLVIDEYEEILNIMRNMVRVMEQSPRAFEKMGEEDLRTHFLVQLNGQYEGRATGETFNFQGKTDILIREQDRNVFIAECKFWDGEKQYLQTIDQLLSYLSWRDTKAAVLIFNRNVNFSEVVSKVEEITPNHPKYKRTIGKLDETSFRYIFHQPDDANRELILTVMVFNIPTFR